MDTFLRNLSEQLPFLLFLILGAVLIIFWKWVAVQRRRMVHAERLAALEKGAPPPPEPEGNGSSHRQPLTREAYMLRGLIWSAIGLGIVVTGAAASFITAPGEDREHSLAFACLGFIPFALGLAYLLYARLIRRD
jgi:hypothetical protein